MKISQLGTFGIIGAVVSITAACGGSPTRPAPFNQGIGNGLSAPSVTLSDPKPALEICANQAPPDASADQTSEASDTFVAMCDVSTTAEPPAADEAQAEPQGDVVISDTSTTDDLRAARGF